MSFSTPSLEAYLIISRLPLVDLYLTISNEPTLDQCPVYAFQICVKDDIYLKVDILDCDQGVIRKKIAPKLNLNLSVCLGQNFLIVHFYSYTNYTNKLERDYQM